MAALRIAVTGGSGSVGQVVVAELLARGHQVWNLDRKMPREGPGRFVYVDLRERAQVQPVLEQVDAVVHFGEIPNVGHGHNTQSEEVFAHNCAVGSLLLQTAAELKLKHFVYASSCQVYGSWGYAGSLVPPVHLPVDETHPLQPQNAYALGKVCVERYAELTARYLGLSVTVFRMPWVMPTRKLNEWWHWIVSKAKDYDNEGLGTYVQDQDAAKAVALALEQRQPGFEAYNLSAEDVVSLKPPVVQLAGGGAPPAGWPPFKSLLSWEKARQHFGWQPTWSFLDEYARRTGQDPRKA